MDVVIHACAQSYFASTVARLAVFLLKRQYAVAYAPRASDAFPRLLAQTP